MEITFPLAITILGGIAGLSFTILRIVQIYKERIVPEDLQERLHKLELTNAVQNEQLLELKNDVRRLRDDFSKLNELLLKIIT